MIDFEPEGRLYIDGEFRKAASEGRFEVRSPSDESVAGTAADAQAEDVAAAVGAAQAGGAGQAAPDRRGGHAGVQHRLAD